MGAASILATDGVAVVKVAMVTVVVPAPVILTAVDGALHSPHSAWHTSLNRTLGMIAVFRQAAPPSRAQKSGSTTPEQFLATTAPTGTDVGVGVGMGAGCGMSAHVRLHRAGQRLTTLDADETAPV